MLIGAHPNSKPLKDALFETFCDKKEHVKVSIPKFIKKSLGMLRRDANKIRKNKNMKELNEIA